jgi:phosphohistidine swiveling domain-containing protein
VIVAREYGIPAVVVTSGATKTMNDGEEILEDGSRGVVVRVGSVNQGQGDISH